MTQPLVDQDARTRALAEHDTTLLVEAGAGTGKTALMAGRVVRLMADGTDPGEIAAITFTELAAGELQQRVSRFTRELLDGRTPPQIAAAFAGGLTDEQVNNLRHALRHLDWLSCTTIHGFCKQLIAPYPVETGMDPGAKMMDPADADLAYEELLDSWLRERLSETSGDRAQADGDDLLAQMLLADPEHALARIREAAQMLRANRTARGEAVTLRRADLQDFEAAVGELVAAVQHAGEPDCDDLADQLARLRDHLIEALRRGPDAAGLLEIAEPPRLSCMKKGTTAFRTWGRKGAFTKAAKAHGMSEAEAERLNDAAHEAYKRADTALDAFLRQAAAALNHRFLEAVSTLRERYAAYKRDAARLDFDDLLFAARDLLRDHPEVRDALAQRYRVVLVDEFQDTDPLQADILWRLTEASPVQPAEAHWTARRPTSGSLFLVGDPKQAIYRFRGADVHAYLAARSALASGSGEKLAIRTNFRSRSGLIDWVNETFQGPLAAADQPGFEGLAATHADAGAETRVAALDVSVEASDPEKAPSIDDMRRAEAERVAELCRHLVGSYQVFDEDVDGGSRPCDPGDIALIAPAGTSLWIYERALEKAGLPIATQAGKGAFRRQEILDLIAVARVLADGRDTLALGALLRGPLVGLTEQEILDCVAALPRNPEQPDRIPTLTVTTNADNLPHPVARQTLHVLQHLRRRARLTTPFELIAEAVEELRVRPILEQRHPRAAERALANVDLFLELARPYAVRGIKAFAADMRRNWEQATSQSEGRPDAQQHAVQVITMHSAKGLEWPIVIPVNAMGATKSEQGPQLRRSDNTVHMRLSRIGPEPAAQEETKRVNETESAAERIRLWYVTCTRAEQLLVLPRPYNASPSKNAWMDLLNFGRDDMPALDPAAWSATVPEPARPPGNPQDTATFAAEAERVAAAHPEIVRHTPSRHENTSTTSAPEPLAFTEGEQPINTEAFRVLGSTTRGLVVHKLLEELLSGETAETDVEGRAGQLIAELNVTPSADPAAGPAPHEIAATAQRALAIPEIAALRDRLVPEWPVAASSQKDGLETLVTGVADAVTLGADGKPEIVVDWKSDVSASPTQRQHYREQMREYLSALGTSFGYVVYASDETCERVQLT